MFSEVRALFHNTTVKMTLIYMAIIMTISLFFSISIYQLSTNELNRIFMPGNGPSLRISVDDDYAEARLERVRLAKARIFISLFYLNVAILVFAGGLSYLLARRTLEPIERAHESQRRFTADASHELRTPITAMQTEIEVALRDKNLSKNEAKSLLESNLEELGKLSSLSESLLQLSQVETTDLPKVQTDINDMVQSAVDKVLPLAEKKKILIDFKKAKPITVNANIDTFTQVFVILLDNAIKYSPPRSTVNASVKLSTRQAIVTVKDKGAGINDQDQQHIFKRFYRSDSSRTRSGDVNGYGLGLPIAKSIIRMHGGSISVKSKANKGSEFTVRVPSG